MNKGEVKPPKWPLRFMRIFLRREYLEEIEGDMEEIFRENLENCSLSKARRIYVIEMFKLLRPALLKKSISLPHLNHYGMFRNYTRTSLRSLMKNPMSSFINIFGLSVAIGICLVVYSFLELDRSIDQFHTNKDRVFLATFFANRDGSMDQYGTSPRPLGEMIKADFPQIKKMCRVEDANVVVKHDDNVFHESVRYVDAEFLSMFTFPLKWGVASSLKDMNSIILSEDMAVKYFGDENPLGSDMLMIFNDSISKSFTVTGVAKAFPNAHAIDFRFLINFENIHSANPDYDGQDWSRFLNATLIEVDDPKNIVSIAQGMDKYKALQNEVQHDWAINSFAFEPLATLHARSGDIKDDISFDDNREGRIGMPIIAIFMLMLACFNYINIAIVSAAKRLKEIGVRKVIGANRGKVIVQFLSENMVVTFFALVAGGLLGAFVFMPWFVQFSGWQLELHALDTRFWIFLIVLLFFTGFISGIYPAFYISKFDAVHIFKGSLQFGRKNPLTKLFLGIQIVMACITITAAVVFTQNNRYQNQRSWGYGQRGALYVNVPQQAAFEKLHNAMIQHPKVMMASGSRDHLGRKVSAAVLRLPPDKVFEVQEFAVDANYFETMQLNLSDGRLFNKHRGSDSQAIIVNELFIKNLELSNPIGQQFEIDSMKYEVIGVLKDFHTSDFFIRMEPAIFKIAKEEDYRYLSFRVEPGSEKEVHDSLKTAWAELYPEIPFQGGYQEDVWPQYFHSLDRSETFNKVLAFIAVMLASLGLYGLVTLNVTGRVKEFCIRKTLGAGIQSITVLILNQYALLTVIALVIGIPVSYIFTKAYLNMLFAYSMPMGYSGIVISLIILLMVLLGVASTQIRRVIKTNPVEGLKVE